MIPLLAAVLHIAGLLLAFAAGWFLKPVGVLTTARQSADAANRRTALPTSLAGKPVGTAGETWLDAAAFGSSLPQRIAKACMLPTSISPSVKSVMKEAISPPPKAPR